MDFKKPKQVNEIMRKFDLPWFVAGGWAIDLFLNKVTREHQDIEIGILRKDQIQLYKHLSNWNFKKVKKVNGSHILKTWKGNNYLELPVHEIRGYNNSSNIKELEILINESDKGKWIYRRDNNIKRNVEKTIIMSKANIPILSPEIVFLYKSAHNKKKDDKDFRQTLSKLSEEQKKWLKDSLAITNPKHEWIEEF